MKTIAWIGSKENVLYATIGSVFLIRIVQWGRSHRATIIYKKGFRAVWEANFDDIDKAKTEAETNAKEILFQFAIDGLVSPKRPKY